MLLLVLLVVAFGHCKYIVPVARDQTIRLWCIFGPDIESEDFGFEGCDLGKPSKAISD